MGRGAEAAVPAEPPGPGEDIGPACDDRAAHAPAGAMAEEDLGALLLPGRELIGHHQLDRRPREEALAFMQAVPEQHAIEGVEVIDCRNEPAAARREGRRLAPAR